MDLSAVTASHFIHTQLTELKPRFEAAPIVRNLRTSPEANQPRVKKPLISPNQFRTILLAQAFPSSVTNNAQRSEYLGVPLFLKNNAKHCNPHENEAVANELEYIASTYIEGNQDFNPHNRGYKLAGLNVYTNPHTQACHAQGMRTKTIPNLNHVPTTTQQTTNTRTTTSDCVTTILFNTPTEGQVTMNQVCTPRKTPVVPTRH